MAAADRNAAGDVRQRRAFQKLAEEVARLTARLESLEADGVGVYGEVPGGTVNGVNLVFTLANAPLGSTLQLFRNGLLLRAGGSNDYTLSGSTITFNAGEAPDTGAALVAFYRRAV